jgi:Bacterial Ig domain
MPMLFGMENAMYKCISAAVLLMMLSAGARADTCIAKYHFMFDQVVPGTMAAASGIPCVSNFSWTAATTVVKSVRVASPPKNGSASAGSAGVTYRSNPGFKGSDAFTFTVFGDGKVGHNKTATVQMMVSVQ